jgi:hypothetical protein
LDGFHFYNGQMKVQMEAHHYCSILNEDVIQCTIYDGNVKDAKLMGVEYIISAKLFAGLPEQEKRSAQPRPRGEIGQLIAPGIPDAAEHELMEKLIHTYGKTWHTWHTDLDKDLPLGMPQLMMGFTADGQADPAMVGARDARLGVSSEDKRKRRADIPVPAIDPGADAWKEGTVVQIQDPAVGMRTQLGARSRSLPAGGECELRGPVRGIAGKCLAGTWSAPSLTLTSVGIGRAFGCSVGSDLRRGVPGRRAPGDRQGSLVGTYQQIEPSLK